MAHFAQLNDDNEVLQVVVIADEDCQDSEGNEDEATGVAFCQSLFGADTNWKQTSYNTIRNTHRAGGTAFRGNYASVGGTYDPDGDYFIPAKPYASWVLDTDLHWIPPIDAPSDIATVPYIWDEDLYQADTANPKTQGWRGPDDGVGEPEE